MADTNREYPYKVLGARLKRMREQVRESLAEVAGSVEIDPNWLTEMEQGSERPSEDILLLLISHFDIKEEEAIKLWQLAGYEKFGSTNYEDQIDSKNAVIVMPLDVRIAYTDMAHVVANQHGITLNFMQTSGPNNQPLVVSRLGMSKEHAQNLVELLQKALIGVQPQSQRALPAPGETEPKKSDSK